MACASGIDVIAYNIRGSTRNISWHTQFAALATKGIWILVAVFSAGVALVSYRYLSPGAHIPKVIATNSFPLTWLIVHATAASTALLLGPWQFWAGLRARLPRLHRWSGRLYVVSCLVAGAAGFVLALGASTGIITTLGFGVLSVVWIFTTATAWRLAMRRDFVDHRRWMIRSFALTFAAVNLRLYLPAAVALHLPFEDSYRAISFLCWVPNLLAVELYLRNRQLEN